jgi:hypothetical protein
MVVPVRWNNSSAAISEQMHDKVTILIEAPEEGTQDIWRNER